MGRLLPESFLISCALILLLVSLGPAPLFSQEPDGSMTPLEKGRYWFDRRAQGANGDEADSEPINKALEHLDRAMSENPSETAAAYLLRSYYVKGTYVPLSQAEKEDVFATGKKRGEKLIEQFPESVAVLYGYTSNLGRWAEVYGIFSAAREGVADRVRELCERMIEIDSTYAGGGPYRVLGILHQEAPYIPFILSWPSNEKAIKNLEKALEIAPQDPGNIYHYARVLNAVGRTEEALGQLEKLKDRTARESHRLEDRRILTKAKKLHDEIAEK